MQSLEVVVSLRQVLQEPHWCVSVCWVCVYMYVFTVSICADSTSSEPMVTRGTFRVKVCSPGEVRCALIHVGSRGRQTKTRVDSRRLTGVCGFCVRVRVRVNCVNLCRFCFIIAQT